MKGEGPSTETWPGRTGAVRHLLGRGSIYTIALAIQLSSGLLVLPLVTRLLDPGSYGLVATAMVVVQLLAYVAAAGLPAAITRFFFAGESGHERSRGLIATTGLVAVVVAAIAELAGPFWSDIFANVPYGVPLRIAVWSVVPFAVVQACQAALRAQDRAGPFVVVAGLSAAGGHLLGLGAVWLTEWGPAGYLGGVSCGFVVGAVVGMVLTAPSSRGLRNGQLVRAAVRYGLPTVPHSLALYILSAGDRVVVERLLGLDAVGRYNVAYLIGAVGIALLGALNNTWAPTIYGAPEAERWAILADTTGAVYRLAALGAGVLALAAPVALVIAAPAGYEPEVLTPVAALVAFVMLPYVGYLSAAHITFHLGHTSVIAWITPSVALLNIGLNLAMIPVLGLIGAAVATLISYVVQALSLHLIARRWTTVPWPTADIIRSWGLATVLVTIGVLAPVSGAWLGVRVGSSLILVALLATSILGLVRD